MYGIPVPLFRCYTTEVQVFAKGYCLLASQQQWWETKTGDPSLPLMSEHHPVLYVAYYWRRFQRSSHQLLRQCAMMSDMCCIDWHWQCLIGYAGCDALSSKHCCACDLPCVPLAVAVLVAMVLVCRPTKASVGSSHCDIVKDDMFVFVLLFGNYSLFLLFIRFWTILIFEIYSCSIRLRPCWYCILVFCRCDTK